MNNIKDPNVQYLPEIVGAHLKDFLQSDSSIETTTYPMVQLQHDEDLGTLCSSL